MLVYFIFGIIIIVMLFYSFSNFLIFQPPRFSRRYKNTEGLLKLKIADGETMSALYLPNQNAQYVILASHGNAEDLGTAQVFYHQLHQHDYAVFAYDYHGYGSSSGKPSEKTAYMDVNAAYDYLTKTLLFHPDQIIAFGHSLGCAIALDLATREPVAGLILSAPFMSAWRVGTTFPILPFDQFNNFKKIHKIQCPVLIMHGNRDWIIPFWHGRKLYAKANLPKYCLWLKNAGHNNIVPSAGELYWDTLKKFSANLGR